MQEVSDANARFKASETVALADLEEAHKRLRNTEAELAAAQQAAAHNFSSAGEANQAYDSMVKKANERLKDRSAVIEQLTDRLNTSMSEISNLQLRVKNLEQEKSLLLSSART